MQIVTEGSKTSSLQAPAEHANIHTRSVQEGVVGAEIVIDDDSELRGKRRSCAGQTGRGVSKWFSHPTRRS